MSNEKLLYRQIHPGFVLDEGVSSQAFTPMPKDQGLLSLYNSDVFTAPASHAHFIQQTNAITGEPLGSAGVLGNTTSEFAGCALSVNEDNDPFHGHASADFTALEKREAAKKAKILRDKAWGRSWLFQPTPLAQTQIPATNQP